MTRQQKIDKVKDLNDRIEVLHDKSIHAVTEVSKVVYKDKMILLQWERDALLNTPIDED